MAQANYGISSGLLPAPMTVLDKVDNNVASLPLYSDAVNRSAKDGAKGDAWRFQYVVKFKFN